MSNVTLKELAPPSAAQKPTGLSPELVAFINRACQEAAASAVTTTSKLASEMLTEAVSHVERKLALIEAPTPKIMAVEINGGAVKTLKSAASPILGDMIANAKLGLNTILIGPAGCGKSFACAQLAEALGLEYEHVVLTSGASETWLFGRQTPTGFIEGPLARRYRLGGVFCFEELDAADANLLMSVNVALENGHLYNPINGELLTRHPDFVAVATANTVGKGADHVYTARNRLDASTLRRWDKLAVNYDASVEKQLCPDKVLYRMIVEARKGLKRLKSDEILSTGCMEKAYRKLVAGYDHSKILAALTLGWPEELAAQVGMDHWPHEEETTSTNAPESTNAEAVSPSVPKASPQASMTESQQLTANAARIAELKRKLAGGQ